MIRKLILSVMLTVAVLLLHAQERRDSVYCFRFVPEKDMFFSPYKGNDVELLRLFDCVERFRSQILSGNMPVHVDGYCKSARTVTACLAVAKKRSNRVKSELITAKGLKEDCFVTNNHSSEGDFVTVRIIVPGDLMKPDTVRAHTPEDGERPLSVEADKEEMVETTVEPGRETVTTATDSKTVNHGLVLRANLLRWATLTPDLGMEWRIGSSWSISVNGSWTSWSWNGKDRRYALWEVSPEVRYYIGKEKCGHIGVMYKVGQFNYKLSATGKQGDLMGGGITGGYLLRLNNALSLDFNLGIGCLHADYDKYEVIGGVRVRRGSGSRNWWGPVSAGVTLTWTIYNKEDRK